ncbi:unnamed protein product [Arabidopsis lyrata]|uniref:Predicted protein n=1 Tax=Arabidopsis lyrata subsp. lyrata TaxID=81972 RepID=D7M9Q3_ARALL|nr:predicted protein [Arabidopsis lyrata subsp. lyrata]CAH8274565.1 unnamed protein product [Arabidopsis lyrata]
MSFQFRWSDPPSCAFQRLTIFVLPLGSKSISPNPVETSLKMQSPHLRCTIASIGCVRM